MKRNYIEDYANPEAAPEIREAASDTAIPKTPRQPVTLIVVSDIPLAVLFKPQTDVMIRSASSGNGPWSGFNGGGGVTPMNLITAFLSTTLQRLGVRLPPAPRPTRYRLEVALAYEREPLLCPVDTYMYESFQGMMPQVTPASPALP